MSSLLEQAIIDAKELREAALRFAENQVIERHAVELKEAIDSFLNEQDEPALDPMAAAAPPPAGGPAGGPTPPAVPEGIPDASLVGTKTGSAGEDDSSITLSVEDLRTMLSAYEDQDIPPEDLKDPFEILADGSPDSSEQDEPDETEIELGQVRQPQTAPSTGMEGLMEDVRRFLNKKPSSLQETYEIEEEQQLNEYDTDFIYDYECSELPELLKDIEAGNRSSDEYEKRFMIDSVKSRMESCAEDEATAGSLQEELVIDITNGDFTGWAGRPEKDRQYQEKIELARLADTKRQEELKDLQAGMKKLAGVNESLKAKVTEAQNKNALLEQTILALKGKLEEVNLSNAKLLYQNEVLTNPSLNERQKTQVVESIRKAASVSEAKVIFETLQSAARSVGTDRKVESLNEAIRRPSHTIHGKRPLTESIDNSQLDYWKKLAGIQK
jgi:hypothetical protein